MTAWFCLGSKFKEKLLREPSFVHFARPATTVHHGSLWAKVEPHPGPVAGSPEPPREANDCLCSDNLEFLKCGRKMDNLENPVENQTHELRTQAQREHASSTHRETPGNRTTNLLADCCNTVSSAQKTLKLRQKTFAENQNRCFFCACATQWAKKKIVHCVHHRSISPRGMKE